MAKDPFECLYKYGNSTLRYHFFQFIVSSVILAAASAKCTLIAHHLEPLLLLQGTQCLIR